MNKTKEEIFKEAFNLWGYDSQFKVMIEEIGEFLQVASKFGRTINGSTKEQIIKEIADVFNTIEQFMFILNIREDKVREAQVNKLEKLNKIINEYKQKVFEDGQEE